jgi:hypothetical protein
VSLDGKLFKAVAASGDAYHKIRSHITMTELGPQAAMWWPLIDEWYERDPDARSVDLEILAEKGRKCLPEVHQDVLQGWLKDLPEINSPENVVDFALDLKRYQAGNKLAQAIQIRDESKISTYLEEYAELRQATELGKSEIKWTQDDGEMVDFLNRDNLIKVAPASLNERLKGGASPGDHILVFGRPEMGKTLFTVNMVAGFLKYGHKVLYVGNEESTYKTRRRIACNLANCTTDEFNEQTERALGLAKQRGLDNLMICHMSPGTVAEIEEIVKEVRPAVVVVDQIRNLEHKGDGMTMKLNELGKDFRNMLGKYDCLGVSITQAGSRDSQGVWLTIDDIDMSRTGLPAACDVIVGVGADADMLSKGQRAISLPKNKLSDADDAHHGLIVQVDLQRSKIR